MTTTEKKIAVVLLNLGGPLEEAHIRPFLYNFFMDKNIIGLPAPLRWFVAAQISKRRAKGAARDAYAKLNFKSPLLENTQAQAQALEKRLQADGLQAKCFVSMRYWHPRAPEIVRDIQAYAPQRLVLLPLYPQYSTTTTGSAFADFRGAWHAAGGAVKPEKICCYPVLPGFIAASAANIRAELARVEGPVRLLLSAHGLPEKIIRRGDPYQRQCEDTAAAIVKETGIPGLDWQVCYQSRVGPLKWIGPSIGEALEKAAADGKGVVVYPHAFVSEHVETLVELDMEYRHQAEALKIPFFKRAATVGTHPAFVAGLAQLVQDRIAAGADTGCCRGGQKICGCQGA